MGPSVEGRVGVRGVKPPTPSSPPGLGRARTEPSVEGRVGVRGVKPPNPSSPPGLGRGEGLASAGAKLNLMSGAMVQHYTHLVS